MADDLHAISSEDPATAPAPTPLRQGSVLSRRATRRTALMPPPPGSPRPPRWQACLGGPRLVPCPGRHPRRRDTPTP